MNQKENTKCYKLKQWMSGPVLTQQAAECLFWPNPADRLRWGLEKPASNYLLG